MNEHTKEPWGVLGYDVFKIAAKANPKIVLLECSNDVSESGANARRIVACVNACAGMSIEELEQIARDVATNGADPVPLTPERHELETPE